MDEKKENKSSLPYPVILLIAAVIAGGVFKYYAPLDSMRPLHDERRYNVQLGEEKVLSRMWQDPFQAVEGHKTNLKNKDNGTGILEFKPEKNIINKEILLLPVLTTAGNYAENIERRLRSRYAVLSALHVAGYKSDNASHIGVFKHWINDETPRLIPYEWFISDPLKIDEDQSSRIKKAQPYDMVLILWLGDEYFIGDRLKELYKLVKCIKIKLNDNALENVKREIVQKGRELEKAEEASSVLDKDVKGFSAISKLAETSTFESKVKTQREINQKEVELKKAKKTASELPEYIDALKAYLIKASTNITGAGESIYKCEVRFLGPSNSAILEKIFSEANEVHLRQKEFRFNLAVNETELGNAKVDTSVLVKGIVGLEVDLKFDETYRTSTGEAIEKTRREITQKKAELEKAKQAESVLAKEVESMKKGFGLVSKKHFQNHFNMYSPWATVNRILLGLEQKKGRKLDSVSSIVEKIKVYENSGEEMYTEFNFDNNVRVLLQNYIHTDLQLTDELVKELKRRGIKLGSKEKDHIVIISEWDTFYGRALPLSFAISVEKDREENDGDSYNPSNWPERIYKITYMRGLDGMLPSKDNESDTSSILKATDALQRREGDSDMGYYAPNFKQPLGKAQFDYIRRLEDKIEHLQINNGDKIRAIGVMGSDIYDKLLILRALRPKYPNVIFFTNDLDARLFHHTELPWTRNLIVASSYGLQLHPDLQKDIPPFRDVYQSSVFAATLQALSAIEDIDINRVRPRIFEIGRKWPYDLSSTKKNDTFYPRRHVFRVSISDSKFCLYIFLMFILPSLLFAGMIRRRLSEIKNNESHQKWEETEEDVQQAKDNDDQLADEQKEEKRQANEKLKKDECESKEVETELNKTKKKWNLYWMWCFGVPCILSFAALTFCAFVSSWNRGGEPLTFFGGISIWPTELIRLFSGFLAIYFLLLFVQRLISNGEDTDKIIEENKLLGKIHSILNPWHRYQKKAKTKMKYIYIFIIAAAYLYVGHIFIEIYGKPITPFRGTLSKITDTIILFFSLFCMLYFTFFVIITIFNWQWFVKKIIGSESHRQLPENSDMNCSINKAMNKRKCEKRDKDCQDEQAKCLAKYDNHIYESISLQRLKIQIIAKRTEVIGKMITYSFIVFALLLISRHGFFDYWKWTIPLIIVISLTIFITLYFALILFYAANVARKNTVAFLHDEQLKLMNIQMPSIFDINKDEQRMIEDRKSRLIKQKSKYTDYIIKDIQDIKSGAFAPLGRNPIFIAILAPLGGMGSIAILQYLPQLLNK